MNVKPVLVTALYDIGRDGWNNFTMSYHTYLSWMRNTLKMDEEMVIFTESKFIDQIREFRSEADPTGEKTTYIVEPLEDLYAYRKWYNRLNELQNSEAFIAKKSFDVPEMNEPLYNVIMFNKLDWLRRAKTYRPATHLVWVDAGGVREDKPVTPWPNRSKIPVNQILHFSHKPTVEQFNTEWYALSQVRHIQGTAFVVPSTMIDWYLVEVDRTIEECINAGFIGSDEKMFDITYLKQDPSKYHLEVQSWREYYDWFL